MKKLIKAKLLTTSRLRDWLLVVSVVIVTGMIAMPSLAHTNQQARVVSDGLINHKAAVDVIYLKQYIKFGEQALESKDWASALSWSERSQTLLAGLPDDIRESLDVVAIRARFEDLQLRMKESNNISLRLDAGLKSIVGAPSPSLERSRVELEQTKSAVVGAVFDFPIDLNDKVLAWIHQFTTKKRNFMEQTLSRASQYLPMVHKIFAEERVPQDLAYLAVIESGFINSASSCANAVGMWQFMRSTGRSYGLCGNTWVEERRDPVKATRAAARYLRQLYTISGDWYLALVGYNAGPSAAERAIHNLGTRNFWDMHRSCWLRNQTKNYVPELCAAILIGRFPERYGLKVEQLAPYTYETVEVDRMTSLPVLARCSDTDINKLKALNPELLRDTTPPGKYMLRVPLGMGSVATRALANVPDDQRLDFISYTVSKKDKLTLVAAKFNLSTDDLLLINRLTKDQFCPGLVIRVPPQLAEFKAGVKHISKGNRVAPSIGGKLAATTVSSDYGSIGVISSSDYKKIPTIPDNVCKPASGKNAKLSVIASDKCLLKLAYDSRTKQKTKLVLHVVKSGDSLFAIANRYGIDLKKLKKLNNIKLAEIRIGQQLYLK